MTKVYLVVGTPGSGKTWVCNQLKDKFKYLPHDEYPKEVQYLNEVKRLARISDKPVLIETPFSVRQIVDPLTTIGIDVIPVFILENPDVVASRYKKREGKAIPQGHLTRIQTYRQRAKEMNAFSGNSQEVLDHLKRV